MADFPAAPCLANLTSPERLIAGRCFLIESDAFGLAAGGFFASVLSIKETVCYTTELNTYLHGGYLLGTPPFC